MKGDVFSIQNIFKDMIYDQQRYSQRMNPAKRGEWLVKVIIPIENFELKGLNIIRARCTACLIFSSDVTSKTEMTLRYCPNCGAKMEVSDNGRV